MSHLTDVLIVVGLLLLGVGLAAYDWRLAAVVLGAIVLLCGLVGAWRGS